jgi:3',5'-cyclic AMP phosphodiesterase CpdA
VYGDSRSQTADHRKVTVALAEEFGEEIAFCVHTGDFVQDGRDRASWPVQFFGPAQELLSRVPIYPVLGNHENNSSHYFDFFDLPGNERWYSIDRGPVHLVFLDSCSPMQPNSEQYNWLVNDLESTDAPWTVVTLHHPFFSSGPHGLERPDLQKDIVPVLEQFGVDVVFSGHDHLYERSVKDDIVYIVSGGGGAPVYGPSNREHNPYSQTVTSTHHYCIVHATSGALSMVAYDSDGQVIDELSLSATEEAELDAALSE